MGRMKETLWPKEVQEANDRLDAGIESILGVDPKTLPDPVDEATTYELQISAIDSELTRLKAFVDERLYKNRYYKEEISFDDVTFIQTELARIRRDLT